MTTEVGKVLYIVVVDEEEKRGKGKGKGKGKESFRYTRPVLQSTLQLMGCKARHAFKISKRVFEVMRNEFSNEVSLSKEVEIRVVDTSKENSEREDGLSSGGSLGKIEVSNGLVSEEGRNKSIPFELYKRRTTVVARRESFLNVVCDALTEYKYVGPNQREDLVLACRIRERKESVTVLLCGTSGCGKSTLSALLGNRLGVTTVISTDSIRHMMRSFVDEKQNPLLWASTYHAGEYLDPEAVAEAKAKRKAKKLAGIANLRSKDELSDGYTAGKSGSGAPEVTSGTAEFISPKQMAIEGFKAQSEMVIDSLDRLITAWEERKESVVVEGVHLSLNFVMGLMKKHPSILPFMIYIANEDKHMERFAVRAKYMTLDPAKNKYVKYIRNIRTIQEYLCKRADKHLVPKINNTNVDKSVAAIHATVFSCLRRREAGEQLYDPTTNTIALVDEEYRNQCAANSLSSKGMFQLIQRKGSSRHLMALLNTDGSVAKAWPVDSVDGNGKPGSGQGTDSGKQIPMYGPLQIGKAEPVNLQFGHFGISAWPSDGGTSHAGSVDESRADGTDTGSRYYSSCCSSPRMLDGAAKELKEELSVHGSDEEADDPPEVDSDEDPSDDDAEKHNHEEIGSVDEESSKSDEEYDDLAMQDVQENGYWSDDDEESKDRLPPISWGHSSPKRGDKYRQNLERFLSTRSEQVAEPLYEEGDLLLDRLKLLTSKESKTENTQYSIQKWPEKKVCQITNFPHPYPQLASLQKEMIKYQRNDGVQLTATLYLPPGYDPSKDGPLPCLFWSYPGEFKSKDAAGQVRGSPNEFAGIGPTSALLWLARRFAILSGPTIPIIGEGDKEANDRYVEQLVASAEAAVEEVIRRGVAHPNKIAVGGHSYGAFMTANLLAHAPHLFCCGIARSGAYNRTLTPFGFQNEDRTPWEATGTYVEMSPFMSANKIKKPILLIHGEEDNNSGTLTMQSDRFFNALKGHGALCRLVILPFESHGYAARESILHVLWETDRWLQKHCVPNSSDASAELDACKDEVSKGVTDSDNQTVVASGGGGPELADFEHEGFYSLPRSLL